MFDVMEGQGNASIVASYMDYHAETYGCYSKTSKEMQCKIMFRFNILFFFNLELPQANDSEDLMKTRAMKDE